MKDRFSTETGKAAEDKIPARLAAEPAVSTAQHDEGIAPAQRALLDLQRSHGNQFVVEMLDQHSGQAQPGRAVESSGEANRQITGGEPLDPKTRTAMESRFGQDFGNVRVHADSDSARAAGKLQAQAFTFGNDIFFGAGRYRAEPMIRSSPMN